MTTPIHTAHTVPVTVIMICREAILPATRYLLPATRDPLLAIFLLFFVRKESSDSSLKVHE